MTEDLSVAALFSLAGQTAVVVGGSGALGGGIARGLALAGARIAIVSRRAEACERAAANLREGGVEAIGIAADVLDRASLARAAEQVRAALGPVDILVNAAGGNMPGATTGDISFFDLDPAAIETVMGANFTGVFQACQVFGHQMAERGSGCILNVTSMAAIRPLTRIAAYAAAKAAVANFTQWLAVHMAREYSSRIRVNALAPGFFLTEQNRYLMTDRETGAWTARGEAIVAHTPMGRLGAPADLAGTAIWLASPAAAFVTGILVPVDGGFSAYSGV